MRIKPPAAGRMAGSALEAAPAFPSRRSLMKMSRANRQSGIALIIVMLMTVVLMILAGGFAYTMKVETKLARNASVDTDMEWLGRSGLEMARYILAMEGNSPGAQGVDCL